MSELKDYNTMDIEAMDDDRLEKSESGKIQVTRVYIKPEVDAVIAEKDAEIRKLKRALYKACANWADVVAFEETEGIGYANRVAERWRKMESKCLKKAEEYK